MNDRRKKRLIRVIKCRTSRINWIRSRSKERRRKESLNWSLLFFLCRLTVQLAGAAAAFVYYGQEKVHKLAECNKMRCIDFLAIMQICRLCGLCYWFCWSLVPCVSCLVQQEKPILLSGGGLGGQLVHFIKSLGHRYISFEWQLHHG